MVETRIYICLNLIFVDLEGTNATFFLDRKLVIPSKVYTSKASFSFHDVFAPASCEPMKDLKPNYFEKQ